MKNIILLTSTLFLSFVIISCSEESSDTNKSNSDPKKSKEIYNKEEDQAIKNLKKTSILEARINDFNCTENINNEEYCNITDITLIKGNFQCGDLANEKLCNEILKNLSERMNYSSDKESSYVENEEISKGYIMSNEGIISMQENTYDAKIYYNPTREDSGSMTITGKILIHGLPGIKNLEKELNPLVINFKGRK